MRYNIKDMASFLVKYEGWHSYATDSLTVEHVCALNNLGIAELSNISEQFRLKSKEKAVRFIGEYESKHFG